MYMGHLTLRPVLSRINIATTIVKLLVNELGTTRASDVKSRWPQEIDCNGEPEG